MCPATESSGEPQNETGHLRRAKGAHSSEHRPSTASDTFRTSATAVTNHPPSTVLLQVIPCRTLPLLLIAASCATAGESYKAAPGPCKVETLKIEWRDTKREREVPVKIYFPKTAAAPCPVILFSHGLGGTRDGYEYLGRHWASHGYVAVHLQHRGSDDAAWRGTARPMDSMRAATMNPQNSVNRPLDVTFALDELALANAADGPLHHRVDLQHAGVAGHSYGAWTTLAIAGQRLGPGERSVADDRIRAAIAMSSPVPRRAADQNYAQIKIPILHLTGTLDESPLSNTSAKDRRVPFDSITGAPQFLVTFKDGDHMVFSGASGLRRDRAKDAAMHRLILQGTTAFWDAHLRDDATAKQWLSDGPCEQALGTRGAIEKKNAVQR